MVSVIFFQLNTEPVSAVTIQDTAICGNKPKPVGLFGSFDAIKVTFIDRIFSSNSVTARKYDGRVPMLSPALIMQSAISARNNPSTAFDTCHTFMIVPTGRADNYAALPLPPQSLHRCPPKTPVPRHFLHRSCLGIIVTINLTVVPVCRDHGRTACKGNPRPTRTNAWGSRLHPRIPGIRQTARQPGPAFPLACLRSACKARVLST